MPLSVSILRRWERAVDAAEVIISEAVALVALHKKVVSYEVDLHVALELNALHVAQAVDVRQQEPSILRRQEVVDHVAFRQTAGSHHDRIDIVVRGAGAKFRLDQADRRRLQSRRDDQATTTREDLQAGLIFEVRADRKSTRLNSSHSQQSRMPSSA